MPLGFGAEGQRDQHEKKSVLDSPDLRPRESAMLQMASVTPCH